MPVLDSLLRELERMRGELKASLSQLSEIQIEGLEWIDVEPTRPPSVVASDSSRHQALERYALIYAAQGIAVKYEGGLKEQKEGAVVDYVLMGGYRGQRAIWDGLVSNRFKTLEVQLASQLESQYVLFDGSYSAFLAAKLPPLLEDSEHLAKYYRQAKESWQERVKTLRNMRREGRKLVFVSKSVTRAYLTEGDRVKIGGGGLRPPDFAIVESLSGRGRVGFAWSERLVYTRKLPKWEEAEGGLQEEDLVFTLTYARLKEGGPLFQLTVPGEVKERELREMVSHLSYLSPAGYPQPLADAHHLSLLKHKEFMELVRGFGILTETGREVLEQIARTRKL
ncbi:MAG: DNA double-strand break repair nuclease NurA [Acidilobaceae archaeon]|nr:DNA double-strand break repair nuclease NurA [Acidilobaceae archaeon]